MIGSKLSTLVLSVLTVPVLILSIACGGEDAGPSRAEIEEIVRGGLTESPAPSTAEPGLTSADVEKAIHAAMADMPQPEAGLSKSEVEEIVKAAVAAIPQPEPGLTSAEAEQIARGVVASIPPRSAPAEYTRFFVDNAISRYETQGIDATLAHYNREESVDGQWYVFIIDENDLVIGHPDAHRLGLDLKGWVGTDANGYDFGPEVLSATEDGKWVSYVYRNPESGDLGAGYTGELELKNAWVVKHDGLLFASGWYVNADEQQHRLGDRRQTGLQRRRDDHSARHRGLRRAGGHLHRRRQDAVQPPGAHRKRAWRIGRAPPSTTTSHTRLREGETFDSIEGLP